MHGASEILTEVPSSEVVDYRYLVVTNAVNVIFLEKQRGIIDEELSQLLLPKCINQASGPTLIREVKAVVVIVRRFPVQKEHALILPIETAPVIVNHIKNDADAVDMAEIDHDFQLIDLWLQLRLCDWREVA